MTQINNNPNNPQQPTHIPAAPEMSPSQTMGNEEEVDILSILIDYFRYWPIYLIALVLCLLLGWLFIKSSSPQYPVKASVLFLEQKDKSSPQIQGLDFAELGMGVKNVNVDNELEILGSREILQKTIEESQQYVEVTSRKGLTTTVWDSELPFEISMDPVGLSKIGAPITLTIESISDKGYKISSDYVKGEAIVIDSLPATFVLGEGIASITKRESYKEGKMELPSSFDVTIQSPQKLAIYYAEKGGLTVDRANKQGSVAVLGITAKNRAKGERFLSKLIEVYNRERAIDKNATAQRTYDFINERINLIGEELNATEKKLEEVKKSQGVTSYQDLGVVVSSTAMIDQKRAEAETQLKLVAFLINDLKAKEGKYEIIPGSLGFTDGTLQTAVEIYNQMVFERDGLLEAANKDHPKVKSLTENLNVARTNILEAADVAKQGLRDTAEWPEREWSNATALASRKLLPLSASAQISSVSDLSAPIST